MKPCITIVLAAAFFLGWFSQPTEAQAPRKVKMTIPVVAPVSYTHLTLPTIYSV